jgi:HD-GYP domain-containing protein (c-di-GMP phosphodiesterase class II)
MIKVEKTAVTDLKLGMFIAQLDRPWIETPFSLQGFVLRQAAEIRKLAELCRFVYVDHEKSVELEFDGHAVLAPPAKAAAKPAAPSLKGGVGHFERVTYEITQPLKKEVASATIFHSEVVRAMLHLLSDLRVDKPLNFRAARKAASVMVNSILRNPDAMVWLARLKDKDSYSYQHGVRNSILATVFGRHLGMPRDILENLACGTLLMDVGMADLPRSLTHASAPLTDEQQKEWRKHVDHSMRRLESCEGINEQMLALVQYHHERHDGSGFPFALEGNRIPLLARIAGLVDYYDMLTSPRPGVEAVTSTRAVSMLYEQRDQAFQASLVEQFIQSIGVYPTGTLVEFNAGQVGVVVAQNTSRRLRPQVMLVLDEAKQPLAQPRIIDLLHVAEDANGKPLAIAGALEAGSYNIDLGALSVNAA